MKKRLAMVVAAMMTVSALMAPATFAEEAAPGSTPDNPVSLSYEDIDESVFEGTWWTTDLGFDVYVPAEWVAAELTDEMIEQGLVHIFGEEGGGANLTITCLQLPEEAAGTYDYEQLGTEIAASNTTAMFMDLNGIPAVVFDNDDSCVSGFCTLDDGYLITGVISAPSDDMYKEYGPYFQNIITSISPTISEDAETEEAEESEDTEEEEAAEE